jgi:hypothetical protein
MIGSVWLDMRTSMYLLVVGPSDEESEVQLWEWIPLTDNYLNLRSPWYDNVFHKVCERIV